MVQTKRIKYKNTERQTNRQTDRQTNRPTDRQTDKQTHIYLVSEMPVMTTSVHYISCELLDN